MLNDWKMVEPVRREPEPLLQNIKEVNYGKLSSVERNLLAIRKDLRALKPRSPNNPHDLPGWASQTDVYKTLMEAVDTINSKTITVRGTMLADILDGVVIVGFALCNPNYFDWNKENRDVLREIAVARAITWSNKTLNEVEHNIPESVYMEVFCFCQRAARYFKDCTLSPWIAEMLGLDAVVEQEVGQECRYYSERPFDINRQVASADTLGQNVGQECGCFSGKPGRPMVNMQIISESPQGEELAYQIYGQAVADDMMLTLKTVFKDLFNFDLEKSPDENQGC